MSKERSVSRRGFLRGAAGAGAVAGMTGTATAQSEGSGGGSTKPDFGGWLDGVDGGFKDARGQDSVTVKVGADGNGGTFAFAPANLWVSPGTKVTFEWVSNTHNVMVESQPDGASWQGHETIENKGFSFSTTFDTKGLYKYFCRPHKSLGMLGGIAVGDDVPTTSTGSAATATPTPGGATSTPTATSGKGGGGSTGGGSTKPDFGGWLDGVDGGFKDARGQDSVTVTVGADGNGGTFAFAPANLWISPGTKVTFEWVSNTHNVMVESQPDGASWQGHETIENKGFSFSSTFDTKGLYTYFCQPHKSQGMKGGIAVGDDVPTVSTGGGGGGGGGITIPDTAKTLGIASFTAMIGTLGLAYFFLKYGGGRPETPE